MSFSHRHLSNAADQIDSKIEEFGTMLAATSNEAQARVSNDIKRAWDNLYNALGYTNPNHMIKRQNRPAEPTINAPAPPPHAPAMPKSANTPLEPAGAFRKCSGTQSNRPLDACAASKNSDCSACHKPIADVMWLCLNCQDVRLCNHCKNSHSAPESVATHALIAWPIDKRTIEPKSYVQCNGCSRPVIGLRWKCLECAEFDLCSECQDKGKHEHELSPTYTADTSKYPFGVVYYTCNGCAKTATTPVYSCMECKNFHYCIDCARSDRLAEHAHAFAAIEVPTPAEAQESANAGGGSESAAKSKGGIRVTPRRAPFDAMAVAVCDGCDTAITAGIRHRCARCSNYDLCEKCYRSVLRIHPGHGFIHMMASSPAKPAGLLPQPRSPIHASPRSNAHSVTGPHCQKLRNTHLPHNAPHAAGCGSSRSPMPPPPHGIVYPCCNTMPSPHAQEPACAANQQPSGEQQQQRQPQESDESRVVHLSVFCDACGEGIKGIRYKCGNCADYDLCERCEGVSDHAPDHLFIKIREPRVTPTKAPLLQRVFEPIRHKTESARQSTTTAASSANNTNAPSRSTTFTTAGSPTPSADSPPQVSETKAHSAVFVEDVTVPDGTKVKPGEQFVKIWCMANMGGSEWPRGTMLVHINGEPSLEAGKKFVSVVIGKRFEQIGIAVDLVAPPKPGRFVSKWRLMAPNGQYFGDSLWCDVCVSEEQCKEKEAVDVPDAAAADASATADVSHKAAVPPPQSVSAAPSDIARSIAGDATPIPLSSSSEAPSEAKAPEPASAKAISADGSESEVVTKLIDAFTQISSGLFKEIKRLDASINDVKARQDSHSYLLSSRQTSAAMSPAPFDITSSPAKESDTPIRGYPSTMPNTQQQRTFSEVSLSSPTNGTHSPSQTSERRRTSAASESSSMREFFSSADRLERLLESSRNPSMVASRNYRTKVVVPSSSSISQNDEFEIVNDFASPTPNSHGGDF